MIEIENLTKQFGDRTVLEDISLSVAAGEILAVVGPSGAGKSTLSRCVSFLERPTSGSVRVDGKDFTRLEGADLIAARRNIGVIFQTAPLLRRRTVAQNVALPLEYLHATDGSVTKRVTELLDRVGLSDRSGYYPAQLSGGQRQRVGIARALALAPSVLLSDEATSGLDPATTGRSSRCSATSARSSASRSSSSPTRWRWCVRSPTRSRASTTAASSRAARSPT
jgi:ABC-type methionine transport system ATPase subunit